MKILFIGYLEGWMGVHMRQFAAGFDHIGHQSLLYDYKKLENSWNFFDQSPQARATRFIRRLKNIVTEHKPEMIFFVIAHFRFDIQSVREFFKGRLVVYDMDGPGWKPYCSMEWAESIDMLFTVSKVSLRNLPDNKINTAYLAHGVDAEYYSPLKLSDRELKYYGSPISFVGRPCPRRVRMLGEIADMGLTLWGRRWSRSKECNNPDLWKCNRVKKDIIGKSVVDIYNASGLSVNILREPLNDPPTILSLQTFAVPSCGTCLIQEWVEELEEMFEPGKELLTFRNEDEFKELAEKYTRDVAAARQIGMAGRKRCVADHTHEKRAEYIIKSVYP